MRFNSQVWLLGGLCAVLAPVLLAAEQPPAVPAVEVRFVTDQPEAVLAILDKRLQGQPVTGEDWRRLFATEGYTRLAKRELSMGRERLIADSCDPRKLLASYNEAARRRAREGEAPALWSPDLLQAVSGSS